MHIEKGQLIITCDEMNKHMKGLANHFEREKISPPEAVIIMQELIDLMVEQYDMELTIESVEKDSPRHKEVLKAIKESKEAMN